MFPDAKAGRTNAVRLFQVLQKLQGRLHSQFFDQNDLQTFRLIPCRAAASAQENGSRPGCTEEPLLTDIPGHCARKCRSRRLTRQDFPEFLGL